ncbi:MAG: cell envelope biogenesis protein TolA, partial [Lachnospiraceae bacterium]|nr:cell envelope biogenesis protein TolA [Lachnospiraceae bacterium]
MKRETIRQNRIHAAEKKEYYTEREKYWARLEQEADDAESMKIIRKKKITPEQLAIFNRLSEREV